MHKRPRLTDGFHRPSDDDKNSSGCSSVGLNGLRNRSPLPVSTNGPRSTSGSIFSRPIPVDEAEKAGSSRMRTTSRYLPCAIPPLYVRAKGKFKSDNVVHVTATAQRIMSALEKMSTPVVPSIEIHSFEKTLVSRPIHAPPVRANFSAAVPARTNHVDGKAVASKYKFSKPWSINEIRPGGVPPDSKNLDAVDNKQEASNERSLYFATVNEEKPKLSKEPESENTSTLATTAGSSPSSSFTVGVKATESSKSLADSTVSATPGPPPTPSIGSSPAVNTAAPLITLGIPAEPSADTAAKSSPTFGIEAPEAAVGVKDTIKGRVFGSFSFGSDLYTPPMKPSTNVISEEMWSCESCPTKNRMSTTECIGCAVPKPKPDSESPPGANKFHFEPFFGGTNQAKPSAEAFSPPEELKRQIPSNSSDSSTASLGFANNPPSDPTSKMRAPEATPTSSAAGDMKSGNFLDALKNKSQFTFADPSPSSSLIPTSPAGSSTTLTHGPSAIAAISTPAPGSLTNLATTTIATLPSAISSTVPAVVAPSVPAALTTNPLSDLFQFGTSSCSSSSVMMEVDDDWITPPPPSSKAIATPNFGAPALNNNTLNQSTFSFGGGSGGGGLQIPLLSFSSSVSSATPSIFGSSTGGFGATPAAGGFGLGGPAGGTQAVSAQPSPGRFSFAPVGMGAPNFHFGRSAGGPAFVFSAQPSGIPAGSPQTAGRRYLKATRRIR